VHLGLHEISSIHFTKYLPLTTNHFFVKYAGELHVIALRRELKVEHTKTHTEEQTILFYCANI